MLAGSDYRIGDDATVGRGPESTIVLASDVVSASHARIAFDAAAEAYFLEDLDSRNGTRLDGRPVSGRERLGDLHVVTVGAHDFLFVVVPEDEPSPAREPASSAVEPEAEGATSYEAPSALAAPPLREGEGEPGRGTHYEAPSALAAPQLGADDADPATSYEAPSALAAPPLGADDAGPATSYEAPSALAAPPRDPAPPLPAGVVVEVRTPDGGRRRIPLDDGRHVLGRGQDCPIPVDDRTLSRRHAEFVVRGGRPDGLRSGEPERHVPGDGGGREGDRGPCRADGHVG